MQQQVRKQAGGASPPKGPSLQPIGDQDLPPAMREMEADAGFQRRVWAVERVAWVGLALMAVAGLSGLLGRGGPLSDARAETADGALRIRYERVQRLLAPAAFQIEAPRTPPGGVLELHLGQDMLENWQLDAAFPPPAASRGETGGLVLEFPVASEGAPVMVLRATAERLGLLTATVRAGSGPPVRLRVLVWP